MTKILSTPVAGFLVFLGVGTLMNAHHPMGIAFVALGVGLLAIVWSPRHRRAKNID